MSIFILIVKHTKHIFNHHIIELLIKIDTSALGEDTKNWHRRQVRRSRSATYAEGASIGVSRGPRGRLLAGAVFGAAVATVTVNVGLTSSLLTRGLGSRVGGSSPPAFGLPEHCGRALGQRFVCDVWREICKARKVWQLLLRNKLTNSFKLSLKLLRKEQYLTL